MLVYEIQTRAWLHELSRQAGHQIRLTDVPDSEIQNWVALGFRYLWFMGIWQTTAPARQIALEHWHRDWRHEVPSSEADVLGSPYAIEPGQLWEAITEPELLEFTARLRAAGLTPIFDFLPNHLGLGCRLAHDHPELFVQSPTPRPGTIRVETRSGPRHLAHGRDPHFPPWTDTFQLDYRPAETHRWLTSLAGRLATIAGGFRCDMAMLVLNEIFQKTWHDFPPVVHDPADQEFWPACNSAIHSSGAISIAEVYWDREEQLLQQGFDYVYNKRIYDFLVRRQPHQLIEFLLSKPPDFFRRSLTFLENHDEPRIASLLTFHEHQAAAFFLLSLPGLILLHQGQLEGRQKFARIQLRTWPREAKDSKLAHFYERLLAFRLRSIPGTKTSAHWRGFAKVDAPTTIASTWQTEQSAEIYLTNLGHSPASGSLNLPPTFDRSFRAPRLFHTSDTEPQVKIKDGAINFEIAPHSGCCIRLHAHS